MTELDVTEAVNLFLMTKFDQCFKECNQIIKAAKCEPEQERNHKLIEAATALGIQALAETDMWYCVVAFITDVYGTVEFCPPSIIQLCILLHAQVKEYLPCHKIVEMWLQNPYNQKHKQFSQVIRTYAYHILCPAGSYDILKEIAENCASLTQSEKAALLQISQTKRYEEARFLGSTASFSVLPGTSSSNTAEAVSVNEEFNCFAEQTIVATGGDDKFLDKGDSRNNYEKNSSRISVFQRIVDLSTIQSILKWLYQTVVIRLRNLFDSRFGLFLLGVLAIWSLWQTQSGETLSSLGKFLIIWKAFLQKISQLTTK